MDQSYEYIEIHKANSNFKQKMGATESEQTKDSSCESQQHYRKPPFSIVWQRWIKFVFQNELNLFSKIKYFLPLK